MWLPTESEPEIFCFSRFECHTSGCRTFPSYALLIDFFLYISGLLQHFPYSPIPPKSVAMLLKVLYMQKTKSRKEPCYQKIGCKTREFARDNNIIYFLWNYLILLLYQQLMFYSYTWEHNSAVWLAVWF